MDDITEKDLNFKRSVKNEEACLWHDIVTCTSDYSQGVDRKFDLLNTYRS
jgi:hypothetical protein